MTSPREAVSILTAAALVVAPVGGVAATYTTGYAEDGGSHTTTAEGQTLPKNYDEALRWLDAGKLYKSTVQVMKAHADQLDLTATQLDKLEGQALKDEPVSEEPEAVEETDQQKVDQDAVQKTDQPPANPADGATGNQAAETKDDQLSTDPSEDEGAGDPDNSGNPADSNDPNKPVDPNEPDNPDNPEVPDQPETPDQPENPDQPDTPDVPDTPAKPDEPVIDTDNPVDSGIQKPGNAGGVTDESHTAAVIKGQAQTPLKQVAVTVPSISFTHIDNSAYVARHYSEDLTTEKFISLVGESARTIAAENDLYASVMIAQAILESASGNSTLAQAPNNNLFGIKGTYHGNSVQLPTREDDGTGATYTIMSDFRQYETVDESLSDYADLLSHSMGDFYAGARKSNSDSFVDACDFLVGRYATDIFYSEKLQDLIETYDLTRFDVPLTYELADTFVLPVKDEVTGLDKYLDPVTDKV